MEDVVHMHGHQPLQHGTRSDEATTGARCHPGWVYVRWILDYERVDRMSLAMTSVPNLMAEVVIRAAWGLHSLGYKEATATGAQQKQTARDMCIDTR